MNEYPHGVIDDPRPIEQKIQDHIHVSGSVPIQWKELDLANLNIAVSQRIQDGSYSCVFQAAMSLLEKLTGKIWSATPYFWRKNYPNQGSYLQDVGDILKNKHTLNEAFSISQNQNEIQMNQLRPLVTTMGIIGYVQPAIKDIDQIAEAIEGYGGCLVTYESNNEEYDHQGQTPVYLGSPTTFGHGICAILYGTVKGVKTIVCRDSAGQWSAPNGIRFISEDFHKHRNTGALYFTGVVDYSEKEKLVTETIKTADASIHTTAPQNFFDRVMAFLRALGIPYTVQNGGIIGDVSLNNNQNYMESSNVGSYVAVASLLVAALGYFGVIIPQNQAVEVITGLVALYGIVHQYADKKKVVAAAQAAGANIR